jgi:ferredoxin/flavodoxin---NADP+ reductase
LLEGRKTQEFETCKCTIRGSPKGYKIIAKQELANQVKLIKIYAPDIADKAKPGQFVIIRIDENGERIPLTLADWEDNTHAITIIFQEVGASTRKLGKIAAGDEILNIAGPLGNPSEIRNYGSVAMVGGGVGTAAIYPIAKALKEAGNKIVSILGARNKELLILEKELKEVSDELYISTNDGSKGIKGFVSDVLKTLMKNGYKFDIVYAIGPPLMMKSISEVTKPERIKTIVSLNPLMVDGMGMCGACRVSVAGKTKFACVDGPEFDAHQTDFDELIKRLKIFPKEEQFASQFQEKHGRTNI